MTVVNQDVPRVRGAHQSGRRADPDRLGLRVQRGSGVERRPSSACTSATSRATSASGGASRRAWSSSMDPTFKGNGMAFDVDGRLIVCEHVSSCHHPLPRRRLPRDGLLPPRRRVPQQPERPRRPGPRRQHLLHRPGLRPLERLDRLRARPAARLQGRVPRAARGGRGASSSSTGTSSSSPTGCASRRTSR